MSAISQWSKTPSSNNSAPPDGWPENQAPSTVNDCAREMMAQIRTWYEDAEWIDFGHTATYVAATQFRFSGVDRTATYTVGRRVRAVASTPGTIYGTITASSFSTDTTITVNWDTSTELSNEALTVSVGILKPGSAALPQGSVPISMTTPTGSVVAWLTATVPTGWLECDGTAISRTTYAHLFDVLGTTYGVGDGSTTFNLPDFRGEFLRGFDNGAGNDPDAASRTDRGDGTTGDNVGTKQAGAVQAHTHSIPTGGNTAGNNTRAQTTNDTLSNNLVTNSTGGNETRPRNVGVMWIIKA